MFRPLLSKLLNCIATPPQEAHAKEQQVQLKDQYKEAINAWKNKHKVRYWGRRYVKYG
jgi:hypothetical protein